MGLPNKLKKVIWNLAYVSGFLGLLEKIKRVPDYRGVIFYYHRVHPGPGWDPLGLNIFPSLFSHQVGLLKKKMQVVSLKEFINELQQPSWESPRTPMAVITFDDGYRDVWTYAWPILKELSIIPTFFVCTNPLVRQVPLVYDRLIPGVKCETKKKITLEPFAGFNPSYPVQTTEEKSFFIKEATRILMGYTGEDQKVFFTRHAGLQKKDLQRNTEALYLSLDEIKQGLNQGIEIGSHTATHPNLTLLPRQEWDGEIRRSKEELESLLGTAVNFFSYPAGHFNRELAAYVQEVGYQGAVSTGKRVVHGPCVDRYALPRISPEGIVALGKFYAHVSGIRPDWFKK